MLRIGLLGDPVLECTGEEWKRPVKEKKVQQNDDARAASSKHDHSASFLNASDYPSMVYHLHATATLGFCEKLAMRNALMG